MQSVLFFADENFDVVTYVAFVITLQISVSVVLHNLRKRMKMKLNNVFLIKNGECMNIYLPLYLSCRSEHTPIFVG